jgi:tripartite-type tricarboxylate transporter receptor subunit TctC
MKSRQRALCLCAILSIVLAARADYPSRPIRIIMPFSPGGGSDAVARTLAPELEARLGQPVVLDPKPGAQGAIAGHAAAEAAPDGYTLLYAVSATAALPVVTPTAYDMTKNFTPVSTIGKFEFGMFVSAKVPVTTVPQFIAYAKAHPGAVNYATLNVGEEYAAALLMSAGKFDMVHVRYKSSAQFLPDMVNGQVHVNFGPLNNRTTIASDGRVRVLAMLSSERSEQAPDIPTMRELGLPITFESVQMLYAPAGTPREIVDRLSREVNAVLAKPEVRAKLEKLSLKPQGSTPEAMARVQAEADVTWSRLAKEYRLGGQ